MFKGKQLSIKSLTTSLLLVVGAMSLLVSFVSSDYFFKSARQSQSSSVKKVFELASKEAVDKLHKNSLDLAYAIAEAPAVKNYFSASGQADRSQLSTALDEPFLKGFVGSENVELVKIRAYDLGLNFVAESYSGIASLERKLPGVLYGQAYPRTGAERVMALGSLWLSNDNLMYSVLVPVGGIRITAYLEIVANPVRNLADISSKIYMPVSMVSIKDDSYYFYRARVDTKNIMPVTHTVYNDFGDPVVSLIAYNDISNLNSEMRETVFSSVAVFICLVAVVLVVALWLFRKFLFMPLEALQNDILRIKDGDITHNLSAEGFSEISLLAQAFNEMKEEVDVRTRDLERLTSQDPLTGIANRRYFDESLRRYYHDAYRNKESISVLLIDIDYFKRFNDSNGHLAGDACLQAVAGVISKAVARPADVVARYGGEEFAVILPDTPESGMRVIADHIQQSMHAASIPHDDSPISDIVSLSIGGCSIVPSDNDRMTSLVNEADRALYKAKETGRDKSVFSNDLKLFIISKNDSA